MTLAELIRQLQEIADKVHDAEYVRVTLPADRELSDVEYDTTERALFEWVRLS